MTESEWLDEDRVDVLLPWVQSGKRRQLGPRKLRLFGVACCRRVWRRLSAELRRQVETAEQHADGLVTDAVLKRAWRANCKLDKHTPKGTAVGWLLWGPWMTWETPALATGYILSLLVEKVGGDERAAQADLLRDLAGNPFRKVEWRPEGAQREDRQARKLAASIYEARAFEGMPILADALEDASCADATILDRLRGPGPLPAGVGRWTASWARSRMMAEPSTTDDRPRDGRFL